MLYNLPASGGFVRDTPVWKHRNCAEVDAFATRASTGRPRGELAALGEVTSPAF